MTDAENLARLRIAAVTGRVAPDVAHWAIEHCARSVSAVERRAARNRLLRAAAAVHGGTPWANATHIHEQLEGLRLVPGAAAQVSNLPGTARGLIAQAFIIDPRFPKDLRQVLRILQTATDISGA